MSSPPLSSSIPLIGAVCVERASGQAGLYPLERGREERDSWGRGWLWTDLTHTHFRVELEGDFSPRWALWASSPQGNPRSTCFKVPRKRGSETCILFCRQPREEDSDGNSRWWQ